MRQLLLLRHAKSSWDDRALPDHERPLNRRGREAAKAMRDAMEGLGLQPDLVLVSSSKRTLQTLEAFEPWAETPLIDQLDQLYNAPAELLLDLLRGTKETVRSVMVVAHNPGVHELATTLVGEHAMGSADSTLHRLGEAYPSGALTEFTIPGGWRTLGAGRARLVRFLCPRDLPGVLGADSAR